jgi:DNA-directed RNA polymerase subunit M/transcription elongation factor TFIIS
MYTCEKCQGSMLLDREVDMESGMSLLVLVCINCGRRKQAEPASFEDFKPGYVCSKFSC